jgi:hypothetical protein
MRPSFLFTAPLFVAAACASSQPELLDLTPIPSTPVSCADPYVEIVNRTNKPLDIYGYVGAVPQLLGQVSSTSSRLSLIGTPHERQTGGMYATVDGQRIASQAGRARNTGAVVLTRKCGKAS